MNKRSAAIFGLCTAVSLWFGYNLATGFPLWAVDFEVFWKAARAPLASLYAPSDGPFVYPPTALAFFKPLALVPFIPGYFAWIWLSLAAYALAVRRAVDLKAAVLCCLSQCIFSGLILGQSSAMLGAAIIVAFTLPSWACGVVLGLVLMIKPQLVVLAPLAFLVRRDWDALWGMACAVLTALVTEADLFGPSLWLDWIRAIPSFHETLVRIDIIKFLATPAGMAEARGLSTGLFLALGAALGIACVILKAARLEGQYLAALIVGASVCSSPYALPHDFAAMLPACILYIRERPDWTTVPAMLLLTTYWAGLGLILAMAGTLLRNRFRLIAPLDVNEVEIPVNR